MTLLLKPAERPLTGAPDIPGDKSIAHRALILGAVSEGTLRLRNLPNGADVRGTRRCLEELGVEIEGLEDRAAVRGAGLRGLKAPSGPLDCANSGTTLRLLMGLLSGQPFESLLTGDASLRRRPMRRVAEPLARMGARLELTAAGRAPVRVFGARPLRAIAYRLPAASAQVKSALLLAGLFAEGETRLVDPFGTRDHTERMLACLGAGRALRREGKTVRLRAFQPRSARTWRIPGDVSSAAFWAAAAAVVPGSRLLLRGVLLNPTRLGFFRALKEMGARVRLRPRGAGGPEPVGDIEVAHAPLRGIRVAARRIPALIDEVPILAVVAATASGPTRIEGLAELRVKESDRLEGVALGLRALGATARVEGDALILRGPAALKGGRVDTRGDHRLAMAFAVAALAARGDVALSDADCAGVSYPGFLDALSERTR